jgi:hypothetical protein
MLVVVVRQRRIVESADRFERQQKLLNGECIKLEISDECKDTLPSGLPATSRELNICVSRNCKDSDGRL